MVNNDVPEDDLVSGRALIGLMYNGNGYLAEQRSPDLEYVLPEDGPNIYFDNMAIPKDAPERGRGEGVHELRHGAGQPGPHHRARTGTRRSTRTSIKRLRRTRAAS